MAGNGVGNGRGIWLITTIVFLATTIVFAYTTMRYKNMTTVAGLTDSLAVEQDIVEDPSSTEEPPPTERTPSAWETENTAAPMANVPIYEMPLAGSADPLVIELKTTVQWFVLIYELPPDMGLKTPELLIQGPGDRIYWGAGPLPSMLPGSRKSLVIPGEFLPRGTHKLIVKGAGGEKLIYTFQITRKRHPGEVTIGSQ